MNPWMELSWKESWAVDSENNKRYTELFRSLPMMSLGLVSQCGISGYNVCLGMEK